MHFLIKGEVKIKIESIVSEGKIIDEKEHGTK